MFLLDLTMALSNPIKFFNAHDKKSAKNQDTNTEVRTQHLLFKKMNLLYVCCSYRVGAWTGPYFLTVALKFIEQAHKSADV